MAIVPTESWRRLPGKRVAMEGKAVNLKTYQAYAMADALAAVKRDLGADAVILNTRMFKRGGFIGLGRRTIIEVTAASAKDVNKADTAKSRSQSAFSATKRARRAVARNAYKQVAHTSPMPVGANSETPASVQQHLPSHPSMAKSETHNARQERLAMLLQERDNRQRQQSEKAAEAVLASMQRAKSSTREDRGSGSDWDDSTNDVSSSATATLMPPEDKTVGNAPDTDSKSGGKPRRFILMPAANKDNEAVLRLERNAEIHSSRQLEDEKGPGNNAASSVETKPSRDIHHSDGLSSMRNEFSALRKMVGEVLERQMLSSDQPPSLMPKTLFKMYLKLLAQDLSEDIADQIVSRVRRDATAEELESGDVVREKMLANLMEFVPVADPPIAPHEHNGQPLTVVLVGPTGVGKTTTLAKLAATFKLHQNKNVGLITSDTYRIAAVDQLRTYANIIGVPLEVVLKPSEMKQAVHQLRQRDVVLIDTAGGGQHDSTRIEELSSMVKAAQPQEVHLVLSSTASEKVLLSEADAFCAIGIDKLILTKLDEAVNYGALINVLQSIDKRLSFITTGQPVPDHIEPGSAHRMAELVLGGELNS